MDSISFQFVFYKSFYNFEQRKRGSGGNFLFYARFVQAAAAVMDGRVPSPLPAELAKGRKAERKGGRRDGSRVFPLHSSRPRFSVYF